MRISSTMMFDRNIQSMQNKEGEYNKAYEKVITQQNISRPSDDPYGAARLVDLDREQSTADQFSKTRTTMQTQLSLQENALSGANSALQDIRTTLIAAGNGTSSDADRASYAQSIEGSMQSLMSAAKTRDGNGNYIFSGYQSEKPPFELDDTTLALKTDDSGNTYQGGSQSMAYRIDNDRTVDGTGTADEIFTTGGKNGKNLFSELKGIIDALRTPDAQRDPSQKLTDVLDEGIRTVDAGSDNILATRATGGTRLNEIDALNTQSSLRGESLQEEINNLRYTDFAEVMSELSYRQTAYEASLKATSMMGKTSLLDMV